MTTKRMVDTAWLEDFLTLLEERGFARAAARRNVTQPAFSRRIQALEHWLEVPLFERNSHSLQPTAAGLAFKSYAEEVLRSLSTGRMEAQQADESAGSVLSFAATHVLSMTFFPNWLRQLELGSPLAESVQLTADHMVACERLMHEGRCQFLLCHEHAGGLGSLDPTMFSSLRIGEDSLVPISAPRVARSAEALFALGEENGRIPYLSYTAESGMGRILAAAWKGHAAMSQLNSIFASHVASVLVAMVRDGRGVAWAPLSLVAEALEEGSLVRAGAAEFDVPLDIRVYKARSARGQAAEALWKRLGMHEQLTTRGN